MIKVNFKGLFTTLAGLSVLQAVISAPLEDARGFNSMSTGLTARATPAAPHFVIYSDKYVSGETGPPPVSQVQVSLPSTTGHTFSLDNVVSLLKGYNVLYASVVLHTYFSLSQVLN